ncbi:MAG: hypothetical protein O7B99_08200 [Planctomycetota bacterium]|nr:hypothetical protein [Planctomycetota bacterium]
MKHGKQATRDGLEILHRRYVAGRPEAAAMLEEAEESAQIASRIHELRTRASLTQRELAERIAPPPP